MVSLRVQPSSKGQHDHGTNRHHDDAPCGSRDVRRDAAGQGAALRRRRVRSGAAEELAKARWAGS